MATMQSFQRRVASNIDWQLILGMVLICATGLGVLYSAGYDPDTQWSRQMEKQMVAMGIGLVGFLFAMLVDASFWRRWSFVIYAACLALLVVLLFKGVSAKGAQRWLDLGGFRAQPSEFMKIGIILALARVFSSDKAPRDGYAFATLWYPCLVIAIPMALILVQPDLGTAIALGLVAGSMLLVAGVKGGTLVRMFFIAILALIPGWFGLKEYQKQRVMTFLSPESDPLGSGYHAIQSKIAVGSGALTGKGFLEGTQSQLRFLPEQTTDFIFSVLAEEWGFAGSAVLLALYCFLVLHLLAVAARCGDKYTAFVTIGVAALIFWQVVINIGMVIGVLPVVGITLPLLSYGGSSVVTIMTGLGLAAGARIRRYLFA